jgi:hypothetical protein
MNSNKQSTITYLKKLILRIISLLLIIIGLGMILVPAPSRTFEIATLYYFNTNNGVTIMDLVAVVIILFGVYVFIHSFSISAKRD